MKCKNLKLYTFPASWHILVFIAELPKDEIHTFIVGCTVQKHDVQY